jgi:hypothetical protein
MYACICFLPESAVLSIAPYPHLIPSFTILYNSLIDIIPLCHYLVINKAKNPNQKGENHATDSPRD